MNPHASSRRIIVIDDQPEIHGDFRKILTAAPRAGGTAELARLRAAIKGAPAAAPPVPSGGGFEVQSALQGEEGCKRIIAARDAGEPFSVAYVDMRMPPGWDGLRTLQEIWTADPDIQLVICTAFSDQPWSEIDQLADKSDRVLVLKKPFDPVEVKRMTSTLSAKWRITRESLLGRAQLQELMRQREEALFAERADSGKRLQEMEAIVRELTGHVHGAGRTPITPLPARLPDDDAGDAGSGPSRYTLG